jgi:uncharacterized delta-60 repeat protein
LYDTDFALARYTADGALDASFGNGGKVTTDFDSPFEHCTALAIQGDGRIVAVGHVRVPPSPPARWDFALARYHADGTLDPTFGSGGKVTSNFLGRDLAEAVALQTDGRIVVAGEVSVEDSLSDFGVARYQADGSLDGTFGDGGLVTTDFDSANDVAYAVAIETGKRIVAAGRSDGGTGNDFALARYAFDGGLVTTDFAGGSDICQGLAVQNDGGIVLAGSVDVGGPTGREFALARYLVDTCPWDIAGPGGWPEPDGMVAVNDFLELLRTWGCPGCPADFGSPPGVGFDDLQFLLDGWGEACPGEDDPMAPSLPQEIQDAGLQWPDDWDIFVDCITNGSPEEQDNCACWLGHYLAQGPWPDCPDDDPFSSTIGPIFIPSHQTDTVSDPSPGWTTR